MPFDGSHFRDEPHRQQPPATPGSLFDLWIGMGLFGFCAAVTTAAVLTGTALAMHKLMSP